MNEESFIYIFYRYLRDKIKNLILYGIFIVIFLGVFSLYNLEKEAIVYVFALCFIVGFIFMAIDFYKNYKKHNKLLILKKQINNSLDAMPGAKGLLEEDYAKVLIELYKLKQDVALQGDMKQSEMMDYYTLWAHQIKTPIAAMRLLLQKSQNEQNKELLEQLFKIEEYVEMVLGYLRIENSSSDLSFKTYNLDTIVKQAVRKYAKIFIRKGIALDFKKIDCNVITDEKWLVFVIEQILSNALKYTSKGSISIYISDEKEKTLIIKDTGIGIAKEDLPRIFEKGFTGYNGRMDKKATGIGLYLCRKILGKLSHKIAIDSEVGVGTMVKIDLSSINTIIE